MDRVARLAAGAILELREGMYEIHWCHVHGWHGAHAGWHGAGAISGSGGRDVQRASERVHHRQRLYGSECDDGSSAVVSTSITVSIHAESELGSGGSSASSSLWLDWFEFNPCDNQFRHTARIIDAPDSEQDGVHSASVVGTFELVDVTIPVGTVAIDLEWSGTGEAAGTRRHDSTERDGATVITWVHDQRRPAAVTGFVTLNDLDLPLSGEGELVSHRALELVIPR
jgi:hypothetical protein